MLSTILMVAFRDSVQTGNAERTFGKQSRQCVEMNQSSICSPRFFYLKNTGTILRDAECTSPTGEKQKRNVYSVGRNSIKNRINNYLEVRKPILKSIHCLRRITWCSVKVGNIIKATFTLHRSVSSPGQCWSIGELENRVTTWPASLHSLTKPYDTGQSWKSGLSCFYLFLVLT